jgi:hypothetical protein
LKPNELEGRMLVGTEGTNSPLVRCLSRKAGQKGTRRLLTGTVISECLALISAWEAPG